MCKNVNTEEKCISYASKYILWKFVFKSFYTYNIVELFLLMINTISNI